MGADCIIQQPQQREIISSDGAGDFARYILLTYQQGKAALCYQIDDENEAVIMAYHYHDDVLIRVVSLALLDGGNAPQMSAADFAYDATGQLSRIIATAGGKTGQIYP